MTRPTTRPAASMLVGVGLSVLRVLPCFAQQCTIDQDCNDGIACTVDVCDPSHPLANPVTGCLHTPDNSLCDNGLFCDGAETCEPLFDCVLSVPINCDDGVGCTDDSCNENTDQCDNLPNHSNCANGVFCDGAELCDAVLDCQDATTLDCDDGVACTDDSCNETTNQCDNVTNDAFCGNGLFCDGVETCDPAFDCQTGTAVDCNDGVGCTDDSCNEATDSCDNIVNDANCASGLFCDGFETCDPLLDCQDGTTIDCDDGVACTQDSCNEVTDQCDNFPSDAFCDNGLFCDGPETCDPVSDCQDATTVDCDDGVSCTVDSCNESTDTCDHAPDDAACSNGQYCDGAETCDLLLDCQLGTAVDCDDGVGCTDDSCNETTDSCDNNTNDANCTNGQFCDGMETCDPVADCQPGTPVSCNDDISCTVDTCESNACQHAPSDAFCDNGQFCDGAETCDPASMSSGADGCVMGNPVVCNEGTGCPFGECDEDLDACVYSGNCGLISTRVDLVWNTGVILDTTVGDIVEVDLLAVSDDPSNALEISSIGLVIAWEFDKLEMLAPIDSSEPWTADPRFPDDSLLDDLNAGISSPPIGLPTNDGDAFFEVISQPSPPEGSGPVVVPAGGSIVVATFRFRVVVEDAVTEVTIPQTGGFNSCSQVFWGGAAECDIRGDLDSIVICDGGCFIDSVCYAEDDPNPVNECQECDVSQDRFSWGWVDLLFKACELGPCELDEQCQGHGTCVSSRQKDCSSLNDQCNVFACDPAGVSEGNCDVVTPLVGNNCDDGNPCDTGETCNVNGECTGGQAPDCTTLDTDCSFFACDPAGVEGNCNVRIDAPDGTTCGGGLGACLGGGCDACATPLVVLGVASRYIRIIPDSSDPGTPIALRVTNRCTLETGWVALQHVDYIDLSSCEAGTPNQGQGCDPKAASPCGFGTVGSQCIVQAVINVGVTTTACNDSDFHTPAEWLGGGNKLVVTGDLVSPQTSFDVVSVCGSCATPAVTLAETAAGCTWHYSDASNDGQVTFFSDLFKMFDNSGSAGFPQWTGASSGYEVDTQGQGLPDQQTTFLADIFSAFKATLAGGSEKWSGPICPDGCPSP